MSIFNHFRQLRPEALAELLEQHQVDTSWLRCKALPRRAPGGLAKIDTSSNIMSYIYIYVCILYMYIMSLSRFGRFGEVLLFSTCTQSQNCTYMLFWLKIKGLTSPV